MPTSRPFSVNNKKSKRQKNKKKLFGFTLVELLIAIAVLALLAAVALTVYNGFQRNARDAKRKADVESFAQAFESNYDDHPTVINHYRQLQSTNFATGQIPDDPLSSQHYDGTGAFSSPPAADYCVCAHLENGNGNSDQDATTGNCNSPASGLSANFYCLKSQR
jgi:prepilin-type N-terminal cleavage/methylation domain-containing protein